MFLKGINLAVFSFLRVIKELVIILNIKEALINIQK